MIKEKVHGHIEALMEYLEAEDYAGYDPYDALNSPLIRRLSANNKWLQTAL